MVYKIDQSTIICHFFENLMIVVSELAQKDVLTQWFASIQAIQDEVDISGNYEVILTKLSSSY